MATLDENLRTFLLAQAGINSITTNVHNNSTPDTKTTPYIWLQLFDEFQPLKLGGASGIRTSTFDCEATGTSLSQIKTLSAAIKNSLHGYIGAMGDQSVAWVDVTSRDDTYLSRQDFGDSKNLHVLALQIQIGEEGV